MIQHVAAFIGGAWGLQGCSARVLAQLIYAGLICGTLVVRLALGSFRPAGNLSSFVHHKSVLANARGLVIVHLAFLVVLAFNAAALAGVETLASVGVAGQFRFAIRIGKADRLISRSGLSA